MYLNLQTALFQKGISVKQYSAHLGIEEKTVQNKMKGTTDFTISEFQQTCTLLSPEYNADYLFMKCEEEK